MKYKGRLTWSCSNVGKYTEITIIWHSFGPKVFVGLIVKLLDYHCQGNLYILDYKLKYWIRGGFTKYITNHWMATSYAVCNVNIKMICFL